MGGRFLDRRNDFDIEKAVTAMILCPTLEDAVEVLAHQGKTTTVDMLRQWRDREPAAKERYEKRRDELAPVLESRLANTMLDNASLAETAITMAIERTTEMLEAGKVQDPAKVARDLSQVRTQAIDKRLALQGRPTQITEHRDVSEIVRALQGMGVAQVIEGTAEEVADGGA